MHDHNELTNLLSKRCADNIASDSEHIPVTPDASGDTQVMSVGSPFVSDLWDKRADRRTIRQMTLGPLK